MSLGVYPSQYIEEMIINGIIKNANLDNIQPSTLDLSISDEIYKLKGIVLPRLGENVRNIIQRASLEKTTLNTPLECQQVYLVRLNETLDLPDHIYAYNNNKSSSGRINLQARLVLDGVPNFDHIPAGYKGELWLIVSPQSFGVKLYPGNAINQLAFINSETQLNSHEYEILNKETPLLYTPEREIIPIVSQDFSSRREGLVMTLNLDLDLVGYKCKPQPDKVLDFNSYNHNPVDFFEPLHATNKEIMLERDNFYILSTYEYIRVPNNYAMEMKPYDPSQGEFRTHYAGFFDPGFGYGNGEMQGTPGVLEVIPQDNDFFMYHRQPICTVAYERLIALPSIVYGSSKAGSHYQRQRGPQLSKHFRVE